ncbi:MAG: DNA polymerase V subunit UmuC [Desulfobacteraceae bacterium 4572_35.1]|nr:MAG: DNA polymerase V subunit UmuC [Desulfobacteraceae bacterium 4572_35.1]
MTTFALVDCNNFYVSCERLFRPDLKDKAVAVLSNNDGCIVARSQEVKDLGIKTGVPLFQVRQLLEKNHVQLFSSNYTLYGDISARVMQTLETFAPNLEIYSIDEAFLDLNGIGDLPGYAAEIRTTVYRHVGIPVSVGIAPSKTLAKLANYAAKKYPAANGVVDLSATKRQQKLLAITPVAEVWGVGHKLNEKLHTAGVTTALELSQLDRHRLRCHYPVNLERTVRELNGEACIEMEHVPAARQQIVCSRSFATRISDHASLRETICEFTASAARKLRSDRQHARRINVFIRTSPHTAPHMGQYYSNSAWGRLAYPTADTFELIALATRLFDTIYKDGYPYAKAGVMLTDLHSQDVAQLEMFHPSSATAKHDSLMHAVDTINATNSGNIWFGGQRARTDWFMQRDMVSPAYTTNWNCLPTV